MFGVRQRQTELKLRALLLNPLLSPTLTRQILGETDRLHETWQPVKQTHMRYMIEGAALRAERHSLEKECQRVTGHCLDECLRVWGWSHDQPLFLFSKTKKPFSKAF